MVPKNRWFSHDYYFRYERPQDDSELHISHAVSNYEFFYEPFYISLDNAPAFDERFIGYGFTRNTQVSQPQKMFIDSSETDK